jgi:hypothetical protein
VVAIGNGSNDVPMLKEGVVGICVVGPEGASTAALLGADVVVTDIRDALGLLLKPQRLVATLRAWSGGIQSRRGTSVTRDLIVRRKPCPRRLPA